MEARLVQIIITTSYQPSAEQIALGRDFAKRLKTLFVPRGKYSIAQLKKDYQTDFVLVVTGKGPVIHTPEGEFFFHLNMAQLRIKNLQVGKDDHMVVAMGLKPGMSVLDCTLGLASDAIVASYIVGETGQVIGLESSLVIALVAEYGLKHFESDDGTINQALRRIKVLPLDYNDYLSQLPDNSFDVVYFDPMFRQPVQASNNIKPLRVLADNRPLTLEILQQARRVAKQRVVVKEKNGSPEFARLGITAFVGGKYSHIIYGILDARKGET